MFVFVINRVVNGIKISLLRCTREITVAHFAIMKIYVLPCIVAYLDLCTSRPIG